MQLSSPTLAMHRAEQCRTVLLVPLSLFIHVDMGLNTAHKHCIALAWAQVIQSVFCAVSASRTGDLSLFQHTQLC